MCTASRGSKRGVLPASRAASQWLAPHLSRRAIRGATDLVRLTRPSIASGTERRTENVLGGCRQRRPSHRRRQLVGNMACLSRSRHRPERSRHAAARTWRTARCRAVRRPRSTRRCDSSGPRSGRAPNRGNGGHRFQRGRSGAHDPASVRGTRRDATRAAVRGRDARD